jgi:hypothetical protein
MRNTDKATRERPIRDWWVEYKVAAQFSKRWDEIEELATLAHQKRGFQAPGSAPDLTKGIDGTWRQLETSKISSAPYWMQQVEVPRWFKYDELGIGTAHSIWDTLETLTVDNVKRREKYERMLKQLEKAHQVLSRTVRG